MPSSSLSVGVNGEPIELRLLDGWLGLLLELRLLGGLLRSSWELRVLDARGEESDIWLFGRGDVVITGEED